MQIAENNGNKSEYFLLRLLESKFGVKGWSEAKNVGDHVLPQNELEAHKDRGGNSRKKKEACAQNVKARK
jgi:hypothetical protein